MVPRRRRPATRRPRPLPSRRKATARPARDHAKPTLSTKYLRSVAKVMADAGDALHHAHEAGVIHRDVKPSNIMVDTHEHCWVLDFGLAAYQAARNGDGHPDDAGGSDRRRGQRRHGHAALHGPRAVPGAGRCADRRLGTRNHSLRAPDPPTGVRIARARSSRANPDAPGNSSATSRATSKPSA